MNTFERACELIRSKMLQRFVKNKEDDLGVFFNDGVAPIQLLQSNTGLVRLTPSTAERSER
jgi:hypothetical protein